jgi:hypothetical protein
VGKLKHFPLSTAEVKQEKLVNLRVRSADNRELLKKWSGRRESNSQPTAWKAVTLPLSYSRLDLAALASANQHSTGRFQNRTAQCARLKNCTARSCFSAASRVLNVPRFLRFPVAASFFLE